MGLAETVSCSTRAAICFPFARRDADSASAGGKDDSVRNPYFILDEYGDREAVSSWVRLGGSPWSGLGR